MIGEARLTAKGAFGRAGDATGHHLPRAQPLRRSRSPSASPPPAACEGDARLTGTFAAPAGRIAFTGADLVLPSNVYVKEVTARAEAGVDPASRVDASVQANGVAIGKETPPTTLARDPRRLDQGNARRAPPRARREDERATTTCDSCSPGGLDPRARAPAWNWRIESLAMAGRGAFSLTAPATLAASAGRVELGEAALKGEWGEARLATLRWTPRTLDVGLSSCPASRSRTSPAACASRACRVRRWCSPATSRSMPPTPSTAP